MNRKRTINIVFIGHVDAGKSTLGGNIMVLSGNVDQRSLEKFKIESKELNRESWYLSWALDTSQEEREKGITVECGKSTFETEKTIYNILDAPGHKNYVPNMIYGVSYADVAILVISARKGEFETGFTKGGQTREHALLAKSMGVEQMIIVINKMDDVTVNWSETRYNECVNKLTVYLKSVGYTVGKNCIFIPISGFTGEGIFKAPKKELCSWYKGPSMIEYLDSINISKNDPNGSVRMYISDKSKDMGLCISGKLSSGTVRKGDLLYIMPAKKEVEILGIYFDDIEQDIAYAGDIPRLKLRCEDDIIFIGNILCDKKDIPPVCNRFEVRMRIIEHKNIICKGYKCIMHMGPLTEEISILKLNSLINLKTKEITSNPLFVKPGDLCVAIVETSNPICVDTVDNSTMLSQFTLRDEGKTIALGVVVRLPKTIQNNRESLNKS